MKATTLLVLAASASALQCTTSQIGVVVSTAQNSANASPCTANAGFSVSEFISSSSLELTETQVKKALGNANCNALVTEIQGLTLDSNCEWWNIPIKTLFQLDFKSWVTAKTQSSGTTTVPTPTTTKAGVKTTPAPSDDIETPEPTNTTSKVTTTIAPKNTTIAPTTTSTTKAPNATNTTTATPEPIIDLPTEPETEEPTTTKIRTTTKPVPTPSSTAITTLISSVAMAIAATSIFSM